MSPLLTLHSMSTFHKVVSGGFILKERDFEPNTDTNRIQLTKNLVPNKKFGASSVVFEKVDLNGKKQRNVPQNTLFVDKLVIQCKVHFNQNAEVNGEGDKM